MRLLTKAGKKTPLVRQTAVDITQGLPQKDYKLEVKKIWAFVRDRIRYVKDVRGVETLQTPERTLLNEAGDCDDKAILVASLLEAIGHRTRFVAIGFRKGRFSHVFAEAFLGKGWLPLETTEPVKLGWRPDNGKIKSIMIMNN